MHRNGAHDEPECCSRWGRNGAHNEPEWVLTMRRNTHEENDAPLIPNNFEGRVDLVVAALNKHFGKRWVDFGLHALRSHLQKVLPPPFVALVNVIYNVEQFARFTEMSGYQKQQRVVVWAR
jgi:hypothetical protein